jgi:putative ABC transport system permease protein
MIGAFLRDLRYGLRTLGRNPGFTCVAVLALGLGIGAVSAIFTVVNSVLLQPLHFYRPDQLVVVNERNLKKGFPGFPLSPGNYLDFRDHNHSFSGVTAIETTALNLSGFAEPERVPTAGVTAEFFQVMGAQPVLGRTFTAQETRVESEHVVIIGYRLWQRRFGGKGDILGRKLKLDAEPYTVVGVMPAGFEFPGQTQCWAPFTLKPEDWQQRGNHGLTGIGRLKSGVTIEAAQADLNAIAARAEQLYPDTNSGWDTNLKSLQEDTVGDTRLAIITLAAAVGFVLLIACVNLANLLLARSAGRRREIGIRGALGAGRARLVRQLLTESMLLAALGALGGLALAWAGTRLLVNLSNDILPRAGEIAVDGRVLAFTAAITLFTVAIFGLAPAVLMAKTDVNSALRAGGRGSSIGFRRNRLRSVLVVGEVALSIVLLSGAGLLMRSFYHLRSIDPGFDPHGVLTFSTDLPDAQYKKKQQIEFYDGALERIRALPGVSAAGAGLTFPLSDVAIVLRFFQVGKPPVPAGSEPVASYSAVTPEYFTALRIPLKAGRYFTPHDNASAAKVAIVSEDMARQFYPNENPLGQRLKMGGRDNAPAEIVGIVGDVHDRQLEQKGRASVYQPAAQYPNTSMYFAVRTAGNPASLIPAVRTAIRQLDPDLVLDTVGTVEHLVDTSLSGRRFAMLLMAVFAGLALALAMVGIYGVMSFSVTQATQEIGIRMALGAGSGDVLRMVLSYGGMLMAVGLLIGVPMALGAGQLLASQLFETPSSDPITYAAVSVALLVTGLAACAIPAFRATGVDPMVALRNE